MNEIAAVGETRKRSKGGPGEEIIDKTSIALEGDGTALSSSNVKFDFYLGAGENDPGKGKTPGKSLKNCDNM